MRKALLIALNSLRFTMRDRKALLLSLVIPLILIQILGLALKGLLVEGRIEPFTVIVVNRDVPTTPALDLGQLFLTEVLGSEQVKAIINSEIATDLTTARQAVAAGEAAAVIEIPASFTSEALAGKGAHLALYTDPGQPIQAGIATAVAGAFTEMITSQLLPGRLLEPQSVAQLSADLAKVGAVTLQERAASTRSVSALQYYAAGMAVMYMLMTAIMRASSIIDERENGTLQRMLISPTSATAILAGQLLGAMLVPIAQFLLLLLGTRFLFGVDWGPLGSALLLGITFALATGGIGVAIAAWVNDRKATESVGSLIAPLFGALSGSMTPLYIFPDSVKTAAKFVPNYWALQGFIDQMAGLGPSHLWTPVAILLGVAVVTSAVGVARLAAK